MVFIVKENTQSLGHDLCHVLQNPFVQTKAFDRTKNFDRTKFLFKENLIQTLFKNYSYKTFSRTKPLFGQKPLTGQKPFGQKPLFGQTNVELLLLSNYFKYYPVGKKTFKRRL